MPRRRPNPLAWGILAVVVFLLILLVVRALGGGDSYREPSLTLARSTVELGRRVDGLRERVKSLDRLELFRELRRLRQTGDEHVRRVEGLVPPEEYRLPHSYLATAIGLRAEALTDYEPAVKNALSDRNIQVAVSQLESVMRDFVVADRAYALYRESFPGRGQKPPTGPWIVSDDQATIDGVTSFVQQLRKQPALETTYNLKIRSVSLEPKSTGKEGEVDVIPFTRSLTVSVVVENDGNQNIPATPVAAILTSATNPRPETVEGKVPSLKPGEKKSVTLTGLEPTPGGPLNLLKVTVGPAGGERNTIDNEHEVTFVMRKP